jgi:hypothetical protein
MEKEKELTKRDFERELKTMAIKCIGLSEYTAKNKVSYILKKYDDIIDFSKSNREYIQKEYYKIKNMFDTLKSGKLSYTQGDGLKGIIFLKDIEQVEVRKADVLIITKTGREIIMSSNFKFLMEIL